ncbi:MAG: hypothetical protein ACI9R3_000624 [Verrucomicrobiales bacterium]
MAFLASPAEVGPDVPAQFLVSVSGGLPTVVALEGDVLEGSEDLGPVSIGGLAGTVDINLGQVAFLAAHDSLTDFPSALHVWSPNGTWSTRGRPGNVIPDSTHFIDQLAAAKLHWGTSVFLGQEKRDFFAPVTGIYQLPQGRTLLKLGDAVPGTDLKVESISNSDLDYDGRRVLCSIRTGNREGGGFLRGSGDWIIHDEITGPRLEAVRTVGKTVVFSRR